DSDDPGVRAALLQHLSDAGNRAAGADARHNRVDLAAGVAPDLFGRRLAMNLRVGWIVELLRAPSAGGLGRDLFGDAQRLGKSLRPWRQNELGAEGLEQLAALDGKRVGHDEDALVTFRRRHEREADAGVSARPIDDRAQPRLDLATLFGVVDHRDRDAVLHRRERIEGFQLDDHFRSAAQNAMETDHGSVADELRDVVVDLPVLHRSSAMMSVSGEAYHAAVLASPRYRYPIFATATITAASVPTAFCSLRRKRVTCVSTVRLLRLRSTR